MCLFQRILRDPFFLGHTSHQLNQGTASRFTWKNRLPLNGPADLVGLDGAVKPARGAFAAFVWLIWQRRENTVLRQLGDTGHAFRQIRVPVVRIELDPFCTHYVDANHVQVSERIRN